MKDYKNIYRQVVLDTETTGLNKTGPHYKGHRIIEIGAVEIIDRNFTGKSFHVYLNPNRSIDYNAFIIHGISNEFLLDKPTFSNIVNKFLKFIQGSELIIHNAPFDVGFIDYELKTLNHKIQNIDKICNITDSLSLARKMFPGKRNSLDVLCDRFLIKKDKRILHSALLDANLLAKVYLLMTSGQISIDFSKSKKQDKIIKNIDINWNTKRYNNSLHIIYANKEEISEHEKKLDLINKISKNCLWLRR